MPKKYQISWQINDTQAQGVFKRGVQGMQSLEKAALAAANAMEGAHVKAAAAAGNGYAKANGVAVAAHANGQDRMTKAAQGGAAKRVKIAEDEVVKIDVGLHQLQHSGLKFQETLTREAIKGSGKRTKAAADEAVKIDVGLLDLSKSAEKLQKQRTAIAEKEAKRRESIELGPYGRHKDIQRRELNEEFLQAAAQKKMRDRLHNDRINHILKERGVGQDNFRESITQALGLSSAFTKAGLALAAVSAGKAGIDALAQSFATARQNAEKFAQTTLGDLRSLRSLASVEGRRPNEQFGAEVHKFGVEAGLPFAEAVAFREAFSGRAQLVKGRNISESEFDKYALAAAKIASGKEVPAETAGELFGAVLKSENFAAKGQGAREAIARAAGAVKILDAGSGKMPVLGPQLTQALSELTNENKLEGVFRNAGEAAVAVSVAAEHNPGEAGTLLARTSVGLRDFQDKHKQAFFRKAGITEKDSFLEAVSKANKTIGEEVKKGVPVDTVINRFGFNEVREVRGLKTFYNARESVLAPQLANLRASEGPGGVAAAEAMIDQLQSEKAVQIGRVQALNEQAEFERGQLRSDLSLATGVANAQLTKAGQKDTWAGTLKSTYAGAVGMFSGKTGDQILAEEKAIRDLRQRSGAKGGGSRVFDKIMQASPVTSGLNMLFGGGSIAEAAYGDNAKLASDLTKAIEANTAALKAQQKNQGPTPAPLPNAPARAGALRP